jgi:hypothetical protein
MKKNGLETPYPIFAKDTVHLERVTTNGRTGTSRKE